MSAQTPREIALRIIADVAAQHRVNTSDILGIHRNHPIVRARHEAMVAIGKAFPGWSTPMIGRLFGVYWTTVRYAFQKAGYFHPGPYQSRLSAAGFPPAAMTAAAYPDRAVTP